MENYWVKALKNLTTEQVDSMAFSIAFSLFESEREELKFYASKRFLSIFNQLQKQLKKTTTVSDNEYEKILFGNVSNDEFIRFINCLFNEEISGCVIVKNPDGDFDSEQITFLNFKATKIYGQGTAYIIEKISKKV